MPGLIKFVITVTDTCNYNVIRVSLEPRTPPTGDMYWAFDYGPNDSRKAGSMRYTHFKPNEVFDTRAEAEKHAQLYIVPKYVDKKLNYLKQSIEDLQK